MVRSWVWALTGRTVWCLSRSICPGTRVASPNHEERLKCSYSRCCRGALTWFLTHSWLGRQTPTVLVSQDSEYHYKLLEDVSASPGQRPHGMPRVLSSASAYHRRQCPRLAPVLTRPIRQHSAPLAHDNRHARTRGCETGGHEKGQAPGLPLRPTRPCKPVPPSQLYHPASRRARVEIPNSCGLRIRGSPLQS